jgi:hypothetical protein
MSEHAEPAEIWFRHHRHNPLRPRAYSVAIGLI